MRKRFSNQPEDSLANWKTFWTTSPLPGSRCRKGFQISQCCKQLEESSLKKFSNQLRFRPAWGKGFPTSSRTPWLIGKPFRQRVLYLVATLFSWKTFSTTSPRAGCNLGLLENLFDASSSGLEPLLVGTFSTNESSSRLELLGKPFGRGCNQLEDSTSKRFSKQLKLQLARGLIVEKIFQAAKVATSSRSRRRKGFQISQCCNQLEESSLKKFSNQLRFRPAWGKGFSNQLETPWLIGKPFPQRVLYLVATLFSWRTVFLRRVLELLATFACWKPFRRVFELFGSFAGWNLFDDRVFKLVGTGWKTFSMR